MVSFFVRFFFVILILSGVFFLFAFSFVAIIIVAPIIFLLIYFFGRRSGIKVWNTQTGSARRGSYPPPGPIIDHDPNDLPSDNSSNERKSD